MSFYKNTVFLVFFTLASLFTRAQDPIHQIAGLLDQAQKKDESREKVELLLKAAEFYYNRVYQADTLARKVAWLADSLGYEDLQARSLLKVCEANNWAGFYQRSDSSYQIAKPIFEKLGDSVRLGRLLIQKSIYERRRLNFEESKWAIERSVNIFKERGRDEDFAKALGHLSSFYSAIDDEKNALRFAQESYEIADSLGDLRTKGYAALKLGQLASDGSTHYLLEAARLSNISEDCILKGLTYLSLWGRHTRINQFDSALVYIDKVMDNQACQGKSREDNIGFVFSRKGYLYFKKGEFRKALDYYQRDFKFLMDQVPIVNISSSFTEMTFKHLKNIPRCLVPMAHCYVKLGKPDSAIYWADSISIALDRMNDKTNEIRLDFIYSEAYEMKGEFSKSLEYFKRAHKLQDSLRLENKFAEIKKIETRFETSKVLKENTILAQEKELSDIKAKQNRVVWIVVVILSVLALWFLWYRNKKIQIETEHKKAGIEQRFLRSQLNPHFIFNSLGAIQNFMLSKSTREASSYLSGFSRLIRSILENSREEKISLEDEIETLKSYTQLQRLRKDNFDTVFEIDPELETEFINVPPMILQPIVENCIEHAFKGIKHQGLITIKAYEMFDYCIVEIIDNGRGRKAAQNDKNLTIKKRSLSTTITQERLELINKGLSKKISFEITDLENPTGTKVLIKIPNDL